MLRYAIKMLIGDRAKFIGIVLGLSFSSFIITQQSGIFLGIMKRTYGFITDTSQAQIWVMNEKVQYIDDIKPMKSTELYRVRGIKGVDWAVPLFKGQIKARLLNGNFQTCIFVGIDDATLIGQPPIMVEGKIENLRMADGIIVNDVSTEDKLAYTYDDHIRPLLLGDEIELNDHRGVVVGICKIERTFQSFPVIYTTYSRAVSYSPQERKLLSFILVKADEGIDPKELCKKINAITGLAAYTSQQFKILTALYYIKNTGIPLNFGVAVLLGFVIGTAIAGQTFYNFALDNARYFGIFKAMGANNSILVKMLVLQAVMVGLIGWALGVGAASLFALFLSGSELSFLMPWTLMLFSFIAILAITLFGAFISIMKILRLEPAIVFKA